MCDGSAVAFRIYDLDNTGHIERGEIQRFLVALLKDNPAIDLDDAHLNALIDRVRIINSYLLTAIKRNACMECIA